VGTCVPTHALLSALVRRLAHEGYVPSAADLRALLELGIPEAEIAAAIRASGASASGPALAVLVEAAAGSESRPAGAPFSRRKT